MVLILFFSKKVLWGIFMPLLDGTVKRDRKTGRDTEGMTSSKDCAGWDLNWRSLYNNVILS